MKILMVTAMFPPIRTGTSFYSLNLARALVKRGHEVTLVTVLNSDSCGPEEADLHVRRIPALHLPIRNYFKHLRVCSLYPGNYLEMVRLVQESGAAVILLVNHYLDIAFPAVCASWLKNIPIVVSVGTQLQSLHPLRQGILRLLDRVVCGHLVFPFCSRLVCWDAEIQRYLRETHGNGILGKCTIVPFGPNGNTDELAAHRHDYSGTQQILGVGAVTEQRNYLFHLHVLHRLLQKRPGVRLKILGHVYYPKARELARRLGISDRVVFAGEVTHSCVVTELGKSAVHWMMLDCRYTGLGTANLEAMLMGVPCVSNIPENLFGDGTLADMDSYLFTDGTDVMATAEKLDRLLASRELREKIGSNGRSFVRRHLSWDRAAAEMERLLTAVVRENQRA
jgi:glycosyltransferase involved in cell wall biosynthesis